MNAISKKIIDWLIESDAVLSKDRKLYTYAVYSLLLTLSPVLIIAGIGLPMGMLKESILLILPFITVRKYSGGFHLNSPVICFVCSTCLLFLFLLCVRHSNISNILTIITAGAAISLTVLSPIDSAKRQLSPNEKKVFKKVTAIIVTLYIFIYIILIALHLEKYAVCIAFGLILPAVLQLPCLPVKNSKP